MGLQDAAKLTYESADCSHSSRWRCTVPEFVNDGRRRDVAASQCNEYAKDFPVPALGEFPHLSINAQLEGAEDSDLHSILD